MNDLCQAPASIFESSLNENKAKEAYYDKNNTPKKIKEENIKETKIKYTKKRIIILVSMIILTILIIIIIPILIFLKIEEKIICYATVGNQTYIN